MTCAFKGAVRRLMRVLASSLAIICLFLVAALAVAGAPP